MGVLLVLLPGWVVVTAVVGVAVRSGLERRARRWRHARGPRCASCDYELRGLPGRRCPECGTDARLGGVYYDIKRAAPGRT